MTPMFQPAKDVLNERLQIFDFIEYKQEATFFLRYKGSDMPEFSIFRDDILVVDRSLDFKPGKLAVTYQSGSFRIIKLPKSCDIESLQIWGVISYVIHKL